MTDTSIQDRAEYAINLAANNNFINILNAINRLASNIIIFFGVIAIILQLDFLVLIVAFFVVVVQCSIYYINIKLNINMDVESVSVNRKLNYVTQLCTKPSMKKDITIYHMSGFILEKIQMFQQSWMKIFQKRIKDNSICEWLTTTSSLVFQLSAYIILGIKVFVKEITIGSFTISSLNSFMDASKGIIQSIIDINAKIYTISQYNSFLNIKSKFRKDTVYRLEEMNLQNIEIEFEQVSFKYPGSTQYILRDINLKINAHEKIAVVGENGAGKTTFVMLLTRMYDPTKGRILLNGIDIRKIDYDSYMKLFSTVYQDFQIFPFSIFDNIVFEKENREEAQNKIMELVAQTGLTERMEAMYQGLDTPISRELDNRGEDLSGGERQRIAIIRALYKNSPIIVFDEPTAALDPRAEYEIYQQFAQMTYQKTAIYISHRIASTRFCDRIIIFDKGRVAEIGTFDELIEQKGFYFEFYQKQAQYFTE